MECVFCLTTRSSILSASDIVGQDVSSQGSSSSSIEEKKKAVAPEELLSFRVGDKKAKTGTFASRAVHAHTHKARLSIFLHVYTTPYIRQLK